MDVVRETFFGVSVYFLKQQIDNVADPPWSDQFGESSSVYHDYYETDRVNRYTQRISGYFRWLRLISESWSFSLSFYTRIHAYTQIRSWHSLLALSPFTLARVFSFSLSLSFFIFFLFLFTAFLIRPTQPSLLHSQTFTRSFGINAWISYFLNYRLQHTIQKTVTTADYYN